jgi:hypothetical protein
MFRSPDEAKYTSVLLGVNDYGCRNISEVARLHVLHIPFRYYASSSSSSTVAAFYHLLVFLSLNSYKRAMLKF